MAGIKGKLVQGVGVNDADYPVTKEEVINGKRKYVWVCPYYARWRSLLDRCYSKLSYERLPSYRDCTVHQEWLTFSNFKKWMEKQDWEGKDLDKDILVLGNKTYSPDTCVFVEDKVNRFIVSDFKPAKDLPLGVSMERTRLLARCSNPFTGKTERVGYHKTPEEAHLAWKARKHELACQLADSEYVTDDRVREALRNRYKPLDNPS